MNHVLNNLAVVAVLAVLPMPAFAAPVLVDRIDGALAEATTFLLDRQAKDGAWRSEEYPAFDDGYGLTPLILSALAFAPPNPRIPAAYRIGADHLATLATSKSPPTYPAYAAPGAVLVLSMPANERHEDLRDALIEQILARQLGAGLGWRPSDISYGGWGYYPRSPKRPPDGAPTHELLSSNLSATVFAVGALAIGEVSLDDPAFVAARTFVERCQNFGDDPELDDGGFYFTPANDVQNKAMSSGKDARGRIRYRSYGSMTADGLRALIRVGVPRTHPRVKAAARWIERRFDAERATGAYPPDRLVQRESVYFYYAWTTAHALTAMGKKTLATDRGDVRWDVALAKAV